MFKIFRTLIVLLIFANNFIDFFIFYGRQRYVKFLYFVTNILTS